MLDLASRIAAVQVTGLSEEMRSAEADAEDCLSRVSAKLVDEASSRGKQMGTSPLYADTFLDFFFPTRTKVRSASFTDSEVGKTFAISGERTTTLLPSAYRFAYFPRTPLLKSYSGSMAFGLSRLAFFIGLPFIPRRLSCADDPDTVATIHMHNDQQTVFG